MFSVISYFKSLIRYSIRIIAVLLLSVIGISYLSQSPTASASLHNQNAEVTRNGKFIEVISGQEPLQESTWRWVRSETACPTANNQIAKLYKDIKDDSSDVGAGKIALLRAGEVDVGVFYCFIAKDYIGLYEIVEYEVTSVVNDYDIDPFGVSQGTVIVYRDESYVRAYASLGTTWDLSWQWVRVDFESSCQVSSFESIYNNAKGDQAGNAGVGSVARLGTVTPYDGKSFCFRASYTANNEQIVGYYQTQTPTITIQEQELGSNQDNQQYVLQAKAEVGASDLELAVDINDQTWRWYSVEGTVSNCDFYNQQPKNKIVFSDRGNLVKLPDDYTGDLSYCFTVLDNGGIPGVGNITVSLEEGDNTNQQNPVVPAPPSSNPVTPVVQPDIEITKKDNQLVLGGHGTNNSALTDWMVAVVDVNTTNCSTLTEGAEGYQPVNGTVINLSEESYAQAQYLCIRVTDGGALDQNNPYIYKKVKIGEGDNITVTDPSQESQQAEGEGTEDSSTSSNWVLNVGVVLIIGIVIFIGVLLVQRARLDDTENP